MRDDVNMRTTLDIDEDVLEAAKELAAIRRTTAGRIVSELARKALEPKHTYKVRNGVPILSRTRGSRIITSADVQRWVDDDD
jgi:hypothetical protein